MAKKRLFKCHVVYHILVTVYFYFMANKISAETFKHLRVYQRLSVPLLLNDMMCNRAMKINFLVDKAPVMYRVASKLLGKNFVNSIVHNTYCKVFSAGATVY